MQPKAIITIFIAVIVIIWGIFIVPRSSERGELFDALPQNISIMERKVAFINKSLPVATPRSKFSQREAVFEVLMGENPIDYAIRFIKK